MRIKTLKIIALLSCIIASAFIVSCSEDEEIDSAKLKGTWGCIYWEHREVFLDTDTTTSGTDLNVILSLKDGGEYTSEGPLYTVEELWGKADGHYLVVDDKIIFNGDEEKRYMIEILTKKTLIISKEIERTGMGIYWYQKLSLEFKRL